MLVPMVGPTTALNWLTVSQRPWTHSHWPTVAERLVGSALWLHMGARHSHSAGVVKFGPSKGSAVKGEPSYIIFETKSRRVRSFAGHYHGHYGGVCTHTYTHTHTPF